jgi:hypothetical protein
MQALREYVQRVRSLAASFKKEKSAGMIHKVGVARIVLECFLDGQPAEVVDTRV